MNERKVPFEVLIKKRERKEYNPYDEQELEEPNKLLLFLRAIVTHLCSFAKFIAECIMMVFGFAFTVLHEILSTCWSVVKFFAWLIVLLVLLFIL